MDISGCIDIACEAYGITNDERDSVFMALRKNIEDNPGCEIDLKTVSLNSGVGPIKTKVLFFSMLYAGMLACDPVGNDGIIHFYGRNHDGSVSRKTVRNPTRQGKTKTNTLATQMLQEPLILHLWRTLGRKA